MAGVGILTFGSLVCALSANQRVSPKIVLREMSKLARAAVSRDYRDKLNNEYAIRLKS